MLFSSVCSGSLWVVPFCSNLSRSAVFFFVLITLASFCFLWFSLLLFCRILFHFAVRLPFSGSFCIGLLGFGEFCFVLLLGGLCPISLLLVRLSLDCSTLCWFAAFVGSFCTGSLKFYLCCVALLYLGQFFRACLLACVDLVWFTFLIFEESCLVYPPSLRVALLPNSHRLGVCQFQ